MKKGDKLLLLVLCLLGAFYLFYHFSHQEQSASIEIYQDSQIVATLPLDEDTEFVVDDGEHYNKVVIKNHQAYMLESSCPNQLCTKAAPISKNGQTIVCLPNHVIIKCVGKDEPDYDVITD